MKRFLITCAVVAALFIASPAMAAYVVDLGTAVGENVPGVTYNNWGQIEPLSSGGGYGGFGSGSDNYVSPTTPTADHLCRMVWGETASGEGPTDNWAEITFPMPIVSVIIRHLDGSVGDSFDVHVDGVLWGSYNAPAPGKAFSEQWFDTSFSGTAGSTLKITITSPESNWRTNWGQLGIDILTAEPIPEPATICLLGMGTLALLRKRRA